MVRAINIAIDGPASSGKGTVAKMVAEKMGYAYVDSGAMYRAVALFARADGHSWDNEGDLLTTIRRLHFVFSWQQSRLVVLVNGEDVTDALRHEEIGRGASRVALFPEVRKRLVQQQRELGASGGIVMDGRDIGTVVLPGAGLKVFLDASVKERALRRTRDLEGRGIQAELEEVEKELVARDRQDQERATAPLKQAPDAVYIDTTERTAEETACAIVEMAKQRIAQMA